MKAEHVGVYLKLNKGADKDIIQRLKDQDNKQGYIKDLIRTDLSLDSLRHSYGTMTKVEESQKEAIRKCFKGGETHGQCDQDNTEGKT